MRLSEAAAIANLRLHREGTFESLGALSNPTAARLVFLEEAVWAPRLLGDRDVACVVTTPELVGLLDTRPDLGIAFADDPRIGFFEFHNHLVRNTQFYWTDFPTEIHPTARIHPSAFVADRNVRIGANCYVEPQATILDKVVIGDDCVIRAGARIGTHGFEFKRSPGALLSVEHAGGARLGDRVEVQSNATVDRAIFGGFTEVGPDSKLDKAAHFGHNVISGARCLFAAHCVIGGSTILGDDVWIGPSAVIRNSIVLGDGARVSLGAVVTRDIPPGGHVSGNFAMDHAKLIRFLKTLQ